MPEVAPVGAVVGRVTRAQRLGPADDVLGGDVGDLARIRRRREDQVDGAVWRCGELARAFAAHRRRAWVCEQSRQLPGVAFDDLARASACVCYRGRDRGWRRRASPSGAQAQCRRRVARGRLPRRASCRFRTWDRPRGRQGRCTFRSPGARAPEASCRGVGLTLAGSVHVVATDLSSVRTAIRPAAGRQSFAFHSFIRVPVRDPVRMREGRLAPLVVHRRRPKCASRDVGNHRHRASTCAVASPCASHRGERAAK